ncbi:MAG TPA: hypothetical protein VK179_14140 [Bacteroidales bacterium]|nr:hypothetical protein [Bacteroidales bacterium]
MKKSIYLILLFLVIGASKGISQSLNPIESFLVKIDSCLNELSKNPTLIYVSDGTHNRKARLSGKFNEHYRFKQRNKYYRSSNNKEKITVKYLAPKKPLPVLRIVLINDEYFYIKYISYNEKYHKESEEKLIDNKIYVKTDKNGKAFKYPTRLYVWNLK